LSISSPTIDLDGSLDRAYLESDSVEPNRSFGWPKLAGLRVVAESGTDLGSVLTTSIESSFGQRIPPTVSMIGAIRGKIRLSIGWLAVLAGEHCIDIDRAVGANCRKTVTFKMN